LRVGIFRTKGVMRRGTSQDNNNNDNTCKNPEKQDRI